MNISSEIKKYLSYINTDDKHTKSVKKIKLNNYNDITSSLINNYQKYIINLKELITNAPFQYSYASNVLKCVLPDPIPFSHCWYNS